MATELVDDMLGQWESFAQSVTRHQTSGVAGHPEDSKPAVLAHVGQVRSAEWMPGPGTAE